MFHLKLHVRFKVATHRTRFGNAGDFLFFKSRQICSLENFTENFITFQLPDYLLFISTNVLYCRPIYLLWKNEKSRRVAESRPVCRDIW